MTDYRKDMAKIDTIEKIGRQDLIDLLRNLLEKMDFHNIMAEGIYLRAEEKSVLEAIKHIFILPDMQLSGNVDMKSIYDMINDARNQEAFNVVTFVSNYHISNGFQTSLNKAFPRVKINYIGRDSLISIIDERFPDFWRHDDTALIEYERQFEAVMEEENQLKLLHLPTDKFKRLVNIFIQPSLIEEEEDPRTHTFLRKRGDMNEIVEAKQSAIVSGQAGAGKSTLLYKIGLALTSNNSAMIGDKKHLPVFITAMDLIGVQKDVKKVLLSKTITLGNSIQDLIDKYDVVLLVDSIDEFDPQQQKDVIRQLVNLDKNKGMRFVLATRSENKYQECVNKKDVRFFEISRFNTEQIRRFVSAFLPDQGKANDLLDSLRENKIIERLPITPLTLSLISILFDEKDYEVPATITDIYAKFNNLVVGRAIVSSKIEFIDVTFRERILSVYGYFLMKREDHQPLTYDEFIQLFLTFYKDKSKQIKGATLQEGLDYLVRNAGILYIKDNKYVCFAHDTYMEYYAAVEYFNFHREDEQQLVDNFFDLMWQNVAVFYAGMTKDMDGFARNINIKLQSASRVMEFISGIQGAGYLLQALYLSNDVVRRDVILTALDLSLDTNEAFKKMATLPDTLFKNYRIPIVQLLSLIHFYEMFNSLTLKTPLELSYEILKDRYEKAIGDEHFDRALIPAIGYELVCLAFTLDSKRIGNNEPLSYLIGQRPLLSDVSINSLLGISMEVLGKTKYKELRDKVRKDYHSIRDLNQILFDETSVKSRFSALDTIHPFRKVKIFVEGKTDAAILEHAYITLTHGRFPYWNIEMATQNGVTGSTHAVVHAIEGGINYAETYDYIIGIFDHDKAGLSAFNRLNRDYNEFVKGIIKRNKIKNNVFILCIPIPGEMKQYLQERQDFNFFEIEHYFGHEYLEAKDMLKEQVLPGVYEINDSKKTAFAAEMAKENKAVVFQYFVDLFKQIDYITGMEIDYDESVIMEIPE